MPHRRLPHKRASCATILGADLAPVTLRNERLPRSEQEISPLANILHVMAWLQTGQLEEVITPRSPLVGLLQLLAWSDLHQLVSTERAPCTYHQARALLGYCKQPLAQRPTSKYIALVICEVCLTRLQGFRSGCVMCDHTRICAECVTIITGIDLPLLPFPQFHRFSRVMKNGEVASPVRPGDVLCLVCYSAMATEAQAHNLRMHNIYWGLSDGMLGTGAWRHPSSRSIRTVALTRSLIN